MDDNEVYQPKLDPQALLEGYLGVDAQRLGAVDGYINSNSTEPQTQEQPQ